MQYYCLVIFGITILFIQFGILNTTFEFNVEQNTLHAALAQSNPDKSNTHTIDYYARFNCGTINNENGPLRPGKYDSDITIFNKQNFPLTVIWKPIEINQVNKNNFQALTIQPQSIVNINCAKISPYSSLENSSLNKAFMEGVALIRISTDNGQLMNNFLNNQGTSVLINNQQLGDLVNVDVLHTVNTLSGLKRESLYLKVDFSINNLPKKTNVESNHNLTIVFPIVSNKIIDPLNVIKQTFENSTKNLTSNNLPINYSSIKIIKSEMIPNNPTDNHALTFQKIVPVITNETS